MRTLIQKLVRSKKSSVSVAATPAPIENLEGRKLFASSLAYGINANQISSSTYPKIVNMLRDTGTKSVRLWLSIPSFGSRQETGIFKYIRRFKSEGFDTMVTIDNNGKSGSYDSIRDYTAFLASSLGGSVDRWQVGNEVDREFGSSSSYVHNFLAPAAAGFHSRGEKVVSGAVSWNPKDVKEMVDEGMLGMVDFVGYHPYRNSAAEIKSCIAEVKSYVRGKPLVASEWNVRGSEGNHGAWNDKIREVWPTIRDNFYAAYYFAAIKTGSMAGPGGVMNSGGGANGEFYSTYKGLRGNFSGGGQVDSGDDDNDNTPVSGNTPQSGSKPSIGGFRLVDGKSGAVVGGLSNVSKSVTLKLSDIKSKTLQINAFASSNTGSVTFKFSGRNTRTENLAPWTVFGNSKNVAAPWTAKKGTYTLSATGYSADYAKGSAGNTLSIVLKIV